MASKIRINLAHPLELMELPGLGPQQVEAIVRFRVEHGPITDARQLAEILSAWPVSDGLWAQADFSPADTTAPEAPGA